MQPELVLFQKSLKEYNSGVSTLASGVQQYVKGSNTLTDGVKKYVSGASSLGQGIQDYISAIGELLTGIGTETAGITTVTDSTLRKLATAVAAKLPELNTSLAMLFHDFCRQCREICIQYS